ncbi:E3 ubiquitin-protein ligase rnf213-alpha-like [Ciona intestinalis]
MVDVRVLDNQCQLQLGNFPLSVLIKCRKLSLFEPVQLNQQTEVKFFSLTEEELAMMHLMTNTQIMSSKFFQHILNTICEQIVAQHAGTEDEPKVEFTAQQAINQIWDPVKQQLLQIVTQINDGTIPLAELDAIMVVLLPDYSREGFEKFKQEIEALFKFHNIDAGVSGTQTATNLKQRIPQIRNYLTLKQNRRNAVILNDIKIKLNLDGRFNELNIALKTLGDNAQSVLNSINERVTKITSSIQNIHPEMLLILEKFLKWDQLIDWLREHMKNLGEVKVMSDLAMISAGETPIEVDRVSCFLSAVIGFSPLLFDLPQQAGLRELLAACEMVWNNVERDEGLLKKWEETAKHLEWLKTVKDFHGSVEKSSLTRAQQINERGLYRIGGETQQIPSLDNCLELVIPKHRKDEKEIDEIRMSLSELRDLQSRLMLIAGEAEKGKQDVSMFVDILSNVENLAKAYIQLKTSGCLLFSKWKANVRCFGGRENHAVSIEVFFDETSPAISSSEDVMLGTTSLTKVLHEAHNTWTTYLSEQRSEHYQLNYFNIHQLTYLCKELANSADINDFPDQVYALLTSVKKETHFDELIDLLDDATRVENEDHEMSIVEDNVNVTKAQKKKKLVRRLVDMEITQNIAKAAVQSVRNLDVDECYLWALENEFEDDSVLDLARQFDEEVGKMKLFIYIHCACAACF